MRHHGARRSVEEVDDAGRQGVQRDAVLQGEVRLKGVDDREIAAGDAGREAAVEVKGGDIPTPGRALKPEGQGGQVGERRNHEEPGDEREIVGAHGRRRPPSKNQDAECAQPPGQQERAANWQHARQPQQRKPQSDEPDTGAEGGPAQTRRRAQQVSGDEVSQPPGRPRLSPNAASLSQIIAGECEAARSA